MYKNMLIIITTSLLLLTACATKHDPAEVCTSNWIKPRVDAAMGDFRSNSDQILANLKKVGKEAASSGGQLSLLQKARILPSLLSLVNSFQNGQTLKDLNVLSETCNDPQLVTRAFTDLLKEYNVPDNFIQLLDELDSFKKLAEEAAANYQ